MELGAVLWSYAMLENKNEDLGSCVENPSTPRFQAAWLQLIHRFSSSLTLSEKGLLRTKTPLYKMDYQVKPGCWLGPTPCQARTL